MLVVNEKFRPIAVDPSKSITVAPSLLGNFDAPDVLETPTKLETIDAAFSLSILGGLGNMWDRAGERLQRPTDTFFNPFELIEDTPYMSHARQFRWATNEEQVDRIKLRLDTELGHRETISRSGWFGVASTFAIEALNPIYFIPVFGQALRLVKGGKILDFAVSSAFKTSMIVGGLEATSQIVKQSQQELLTWGESARAIALGTFLGGVGGAVAGTFAARSQRISQGLEELLTLPPANMRAHGDPLFAPNWEDINIILKREGLISKLIPKLTPGLRTLTSKISSSRKASANLAETGVILSGEAPEAAIETIVKSRLGKLLVELDESRLKHFSDFLKRTGQGGARQEINKFFRRGDLFDTFVEDIGKSMRRGDVSDIPEVAKAAKVGRKINDQITKEALGLDLFGIKAKKVKNAEAASNKANSALKRSEEKIGKLVDTQKAQKESKKKVSKKKAKTAALKIERLELENKKLKENLEISQKNLEAANKFEPQLSDLSLKGTAKSHFARLYNKALIKKDPEAFEDAITKYIMKSNEVTETEAKSVAREVYESIVGAPESRARTFDPIVVKRGPLKDRTLLIPDEVMEPWLINDSSIVMERFLKTMITDIELTRRFGDVTGEKVFAAIREEVRLKELQIPGQAKNLRKQMASDVKDIKGMIDRLRGLEGLAYENHGGWTILRTIRNFNNARFMGLIGLNAFTDFGQVAMQQGLLRTMGTTTKLFILKVAKPSAYKNVIKDLKAMSVGTDAITGSRRSLYDLGTGDPIGNRLEQLSHQAANFTFKTSLMSHIDGLTKKIAGYTAAERIHRNVLSGFSKLSKSELSWMRNLGIKDADYTALGSQFRQFSRTQDGFKIFNTAKWTDARSSRTFEAALKKTESVSIITPGIGDAPLIFDNPAFQLIFQYKRFIMAAMQRSLIPALQRTDAGVLSGITVMVAGGILREVIKDIINGKDPSERSIEEIILKGILRSDVVSYIPDLWEFGQALIGENPYGHDAVSIALGPSATLFKTDVPRIFQMGGNVLKGESVTKQQVRSARALMPFQNLWYVTTLLSKTQNEINAKIDNNF